MRIDRANFTGLAATARPQITQKALQPASPEQLDTVERDHREMGLGRDISGVIGGGIGAVGGTVLGVIMGHSASLSVGALGSAAIGAVVGAGVGCLLGRLSYSGSGDFI